MRTSDKRGVYVVTTDQQTGQQEEISLYRKSYAVIIGIDQYKHLPYDMQLSYAVKDAKGVEKIIKKQFNFDKIYTLYNEEATKNNIINLLSGELTKATDQDSVFIFWSGHGYTEKISIGGYLGYLIPYDGTLEDNQLHKNISMTLIKEDISKRIPAKHIFYVMDSCYSGLLAAKRGAPRKSNRDINYLREITKETSRQVLTAGSINQQILDGGPMGHSVFTGRFVELLKSADDYITAHEISTSVKEKVFSDARARGHKQTNGFVALKKKIVQKYNKEVEPLIKALKDLSAQEFQISSQDLKLEIGRYNGEFDVYPVSIQSLKSYNGVMLACRANIPIPRQEAKVFKQHFQNKILRPEIKGNFQSVEFFRIAEAYVIDDATNKKYDLFSSKFVEIGNEIVYDSVTNILWLKDANFFSGELYYDDAMKACENLKVFGLSGWRIPSLSEIQRMKTVYKKQETHSFINVQREYMYYHKNRCVCNKFFNNEQDHCGDSYVWPVRGR